jgi:hypothetical protein
VSERKNGKEGKRRMEWREGGKMGGEEAMGTLTLLAATVFDAPSRPSMGRTAFSG